MGEKKKPLCFPVSTRDPDLCLKSYLEGKSHKDLKDSTEASKATFLHQLYHLDLKSLNNVFWLLQRTSPKQTGIGMILVL